MARASVARKPKHVAHGMTSRNIDDLMTVNEQLAALIDARVPLDFGLGAETRHSHRVLERFHASVARQVSRGEPLYGAVKENTTAPRAYRYLMLSWLRGGQLSSVVQHSHDVAASSEDAQRALRAGFFYPLLLCFLVYLGTIGFCLYLVPVLTAMYDSPDVRPGPWLELMRMLAETLPSWVAIPPAVFLIWAFWKFWSRRRCTARGSLAAVLKSPASARHNAHFAELLADLLDAGTPRDEALELAAGATGHESLLAAARAESNDNSAAQQREIDSTLSKQLPPLLRWALFSAEAEPQRSSVIRLAAGVYRNAAQQRTRRASSLIALVALIVVGGGITLLYGLMLFLPMVEMLRAIPL